jgi:hypothetical protein
MTFTPERSSVNQRVQIGAESTIGTAVPAGKLLECFDWVFGINGDVVDYTPTGHKYVNVQEENTEWTDITLGGEMDYNGLIYPAGGVFGAVTPAAHGSSSVAKDWIYTPPVFGSVAPQTYTLQQGDSTRAHQTAYTLFTDFGYTVTRKDAKLTGKAITQPISDGVTLTSSPTAVALAPTVAKQYNIYLDSTSGALGTTQLLKVLQVVYSFSGVYGPFWPINRANIGYTSHVDLVPKSDIKIKLEADAAGMALLIYLQQGTTYYLRVQAVGSVIDNNQTLTIGGGAVSGNFTLTYKGQTTANIAYSSSLTAATVQTAFQLLSTVSTNCTVSGSNGGPYTFAFSGALASDTTAMTATNVSLTGGTPTIVVTQTQIYNTFTHDMAIKVGKPSTFSDDSGIFAIEWAAVIVEDPSWGSGKAQTMTLTNLITAL